MEKKINKILTILKCSFFGGWTIFVLLLIIGEILGLGFNGTVEPKSMTEYLLQIICVACVLLIIPFVMKFFTLKTTKNVKRMNMDEALNAYLGWSVFRLEAIFAVSIFCLCSYFLTLNISCGICSLIGMCATFFCYPSKEKISLYLETYNQE